VIELHQGRLLPSCDSRLKPVRDACADRFASFDDCRTNSTSTNADWRAWTDRRKSSDTLPTRRSSSARVDPSWPGHTLPPGRTQARWNLAQLAAQRNPSRQPPASAENSCWRLSAYALRQGLAAGPREKVAGSGAVHRAGPAHDDNHVRQCVCQAAGWVERSDTHRVTMLEWRHGRRRLE